MALLAKHRGTIHKKLSPLIGDEEAEALLAQFPSRDDEEPITKHHLDAELAKLRGEMKDLRTELKEDIGNLRVEVKELRGELKEDVATLRNDVMGEMSDLRTKMSDVEVTVYKEIRRLMVWVISVVVACMGVVAAVANAVG